MEQAFLRYWGPDRDQYSDRPWVLFLTDHLSWLDPCHKILDLGCGVGNLVMRLKDMGKEAYGVTYQPMEVKRGKEKYGVELILADIHDLPFEDDSFDAIVMWDSLEHCVSPYVALCEARRVVRPGGRGLIFIPGQDWQDCRYHIIVPTRKQMVHLFKLSGWKLEHLADKSNDNQLEMAVYEISKDPDFVPWFPR